MKLLRYITDFIGGVLFIVGGIMLSVGAMMLSDEAAQELSDIGIADEERERMKRKGR